MWQKNVKERVSAKISNLLIATNLSKKKRITEGCMKFSKEILRRMFLVGCNLLVPKKRGWIALKENEKSFERVVKARFSSRVKKKINFWSIRNQIPLASTPCCCFFSNYMPNNEASVWIIIHIAICLVADSATKTQRRNRKERYMR